VKPDSFIRNHREELKEFEEAGVIETKKTRNGFQLDFTEEGDQLMKMMVGLNTDMQLFIFQMLWNKEYQNYEAGAERLIAIASDCKEVAEINILRTIESRIDELEGLEIKGDSLPEEIVRPFDPEVEG